MSDERDGEGGEGEGPPRSEVVGATIQIDALIDADAVLEDSGAGELEAPEMSDTMYDEAPEGSHVPPPLPKRGPKKSVVIAALTIVLALSVGAAFAASSILTPPVAPASTAVAAPSRPAIVPPAAPPTPALEARAAEPLRRAHAPITIEAIEITGGSLDEDGGAP